MRIWLSVSVGILFALSAACGNDDGDQGGSDAGTAGEASGEGGDSGGSTSAGAGPGGASSGGRSGDGGRAGDASGGASGAGAAEGNTLSIPAEVPYCGTPRQDATLEEDLAAKALLTIGAGEFSLPSDTGEYTLTLPVRAERADETLEPEGEGSLTVTFEQVDTNDHYAYRYAQPTTGAAEIVMTGNAWLPPGEYGEFVVDAAGPAVEGETYQSFSLCHGAECLADPRDTGFAPCDAQNYLRQTHTLEFTGGSIVLEFLEWYGDHPAGHEPARFVRASGELDGETFEQTDYFKLPYSGTHHHFVRSFGVILPTRIGSACALRIEEIDPGATEITGTVSTADCDLAAIEARTVTSQLTDLGM